MLEQIRTTETPAFHTPHELLEAIKANPVLEKALEYMQPSYRTSCDIHATLKDIKIPQASYFVKQDILKNAHTEEQLTRIFEIVQTLALNLEREATKKDVARDRSNIILTARFRK
mgnify:CR=1 FL=1